MSLERIKPATHEEWLKARAMQGIGGSEAAIVCDISPWKSASTLWLEKAGRKTVPEIKGNEAIDLGTALEPAIRAVFSAKHPEIQVSYNQYDLLYQTERPWLFATLDGELTKQDGRQGILEIKTSTIMRKADSVKWENGNIPQYYLCQCCHQLLATGWDFVYLAAFLMNPERDKCSYVEYELERTDLTGSLDYILRQEERFMENLRNGRLPPATLRF